MFPSESTELPPNEPTWKMPVPICSCGKKISTDQERKIKAHWGKEWETYFDMFWKGDRGSGSWLVAPSTVKRFIKSLFV